MSSESETAVVYWHSHKSHNASVLLYHVVLRSQYRRVVIEDEDADSALREVCLQIAERHDIDFIEIGTECEHVHFLLRSVPSLSVSKIVRTLTSITEREVCARCPQIKKKLWGAPLWADDYFVSTLAPHGNAMTIGEYLQNRGTGDYQRLHPQQPVLFET